MSLRSIIFASILASLLTGLSAQIPSIGECRSLEDYRWTNVEAAGEVTGRHENAFIEFGGKSFRWHPISGIIFPPSK
jgi:hypothetical protein